MNGGEFVVSYAPEPAMQAVARRKAELRQRVFSLVISILIGVAIWYFYRDQLGTWGPWVIALSSATGLIWLAISLVGLSIARGELKRVGEGPAVAVTREGLWVAAQWLSWPQVGGLKAEPRSLGRSPELVFESREGQSARVPMDYLDALPATLDSAIRALSGGRSWIDLSRLDD
ncbi:MAG: hypothetical protein HZY73_04740 [Micropruina sp.]|nr:MAG: hypothetical protein HZY73_04740 [Micropruina sp.]